MNLFVVTAAGGNATAIQVLSARRPRNWYAEQGRYLISKYAHLGVEQVGFLISDENHFEMSGAELCGNGTRAAGLLLAVTNQSNIVQFSTSGHTGNVRVDVDDYSSRVPYVKGSFPNLKALAHQIQISGIDKAKIVDLGGIVHVVVYGKFPHDYISEHRRICAELNLTQRDAVGVDWIQVLNDYVVMDPVVWVREINSYFHESSCGSGSISVAVSTHITSIVQPSGQSIIVEKSEGIMSIASKMEIAYAE